MEVGIGWRALRKIRRDGGWYGIEVPGGEYGKKNLY